MFFEEALAAMRFGEAVICDGRSDPLCIIDDQICELTHNGFEPLDGVVFGAEFHREMKNRF